MMTGVDPHSAGMGGNHGVNAANQIGQPGYEGHLRKDVVTIAELLNDAGYHTYMTGKWHLGKGENNPAARGYEKSFALLNGAASRQTQRAQVVASLSNHLFGMHPYHMPTSQFPGTRDY